MNVVEIDQKKDLLVRFAKREPVRSEIGQIQSNTSETVQILKSMSGGFKRISAVEDSLPSRSVEPAAPIFSPQIAVPAPVIVTKETTAPSPEAVKPLKEPVKPKKGVVVRVTKPKVPAALPAEKTIDRTIDKKTTEKPAKPQKEGVRAEPAGKKPEPSPKEDLTEERRTKGLFKGFKSLFSKAFKREDKDRKELIDTEDAKETGMLALLGPLAPAIQEVKNLAGKRDEDEPGRLSKMIGLFKKKKPDEAEEEKEKPEKKVKGGVRDEKGQFIKASAKKAEESPDIVEKLDIIHDDLVEGDKDQEKRDKKMMKAVAAGAGTDGGILDMLPGRRGRGGPAGRAKRVPSAKKPGLLGRVLRGGKAAKVPRVAGKVGPFARAGGAITKLLGPLGGFVKILGKIAAPLAIVMGIFDGVMGWGRAAEISGKIEKDVTTGDKVQAAASSVLSGLTLGLVEAKTIYKGIESAASVFKSKKKPGAEPYDPYARTRGYSRAAKGTPPREDKKPASVYQRYGYSAMVAGAIPKKATPNLKGEPGESESRARKIPVTEDRRPRVARRDEELQKQIDASNEDLMSESKKQTELLKKLLEKKGESPMISREENISNGISNQSDQLAIKGLD